MGSGSGQVQQAKLGSWGYTSLALSTLILSPCRHMFRCWPEESPAHWGGSDDPSEGGRAGGGTAGGGLPLNFQHRSVQDGMSNFFNPLLLIPSTLKAALPNSNPAVSEFVDKMAYVNGDTHVLTQHCLRTVREAVFGGVFFFFSISFFLAITTGIGVEVRRGQVRFICGCLIHTHQKWRLHTACVRFVLFSPEFESVRSKVVATDCCICTKGYLLPLHWTPKTHQMLL